MKTTKIITTLPTKILLRDLLDQRLPCDYRSACRNEFFKRAEL